MYQVLHEYFNGFTDIDEAVFNEIAGYFKEQKVKQNEYILSEGEVCRFNIFVCQGCIRFYTRSGEGDEHTRYFAFEGSFGTALTSFITQEPSEEYIQSVEKSVILKVSRRDFYEMVGKMPEMAHVYRHILESAYITSQQRIYGLQYLTALERLRWLLEYRPKILSRIPNKLVASYLGITPYTLSRLKSKL